MVAESYTRVPMSIETFDVQLTRSVNEFNNQVVYGVSDKFQTAPSSTYLLYKEVEQENQKKKDTNLLKEEKKELTHERDQIQRKYPRDNRLINMNRRLKEIDKQLAGIR